MTWRTKKSIEARGNFAQRLGFREWLPGTPLDSLMRDCITHHKLCEHSCNGCTREKLPAESWKAYDKARVKQVEWIDHRLGVVADRIKRKAHDLGLWVSFQGDPRGATVRFKPMKLGTFLRNEWQHVEDPQLVGADVWNWR